MIGIEAIYGLKKINLDNIKYKDIKKFDLDYSLIKLKKEIIDKCEKKIEKYNFNKNDRIVCLHVRDSVFRNDEGRKDYRNSNIENYLETIKYLIQQNYKVVRMGKKSKIKLNFTNENFFDYSFSNIKDDLLDLYLIERCSFYIGTQSGILDVAQMFNKPILLTNMCELYTSFPRKKNDRGIFKKIYKKDVKEKISLEDFASMEFKYHDPQIEIEKLIFEQNIQRQEKPIQLH